MKFVSTVWRLRAKWFPRNSWTCTIILHHLVAWFGKDKNHSVHLGDHKKCAYLAKWSKRQSTLKNTNKKVESINCSVIILTSEWSEQPPLVSLCEDATVAGGVSSLLCGSEISNGKISHSKRFGPSHEYFTRFIFFWKVFFIFISVYTNESTQQIYTLFGLLFV